MNTNQYTRNTSLLHWPGEGAGHVTAGDAASPPIPGLRGGQWQPELGWGVVTPDPGLAGAHHGDDVNMDIERTDTRLGHLETESQ